MMITRTSGEIVYSKAFDLEKSMETPVPPALMEHIADGGILVSSQNKHSSPDWRG